MTKKLLLLLVLTLFIISGCKKDSDLSSPEKTFEKFLDIMIEDPNLTGLDKIIASDKITQETYADIISNEDVREKWNQEFKEVFLDENGNRLEVQIIEVQYPTWGLNTSVEKMYDTIIYFKVGSSPTEYSQSFFKEGEEWKVALD